MHRTDLLPIGELAARTGVAKGFVLVAAGGDHGIEAGETGSTRSARTQRVLSARRAIRMIRVWRVESQQLAEVISGASVIAPGRLFASCTRSRGVFTGTLGFTTKTMVPRAICDTGAKSLSVL
mgnify:CR=1 FL=1